MKYATKYVLVPFAEYNRERNQQTKYALPSANEDAREEFSALVRNLQSSAPAEKVVERDSAHAYRLRKILENSKALKKKQSDGEARNLERLLGNLLKSTKPVDNDYNGERDKDDKASERDDNDDEEQATTSEFGSTPIRRAGEDDVAKILAWEQPSEKKRKRKKSADRLLASTPAPAGRRKKPAKGVKLFPSPVTPETTGALTRANRWKRLNNLKRK